MASGAMDLCSCDCKGCIRGYVNTSTSGNCENIGRSCRAYFSVASSLDRIYLVCQYAVALFNLINYVSGL